jgi:methylglyoxal synthase
MSEKTIIGVLASRNSKEKLAELIDTFNSIERRKKEKGKNPDDFFNCFHFLITGGTYECMSTGKTQNGKDIPPLDEAARKRLENVNQVTRLPTRDDGGVTLLAYTVCQRQCSILWTFLTPMSGDWMNSENLALMRLADLYHVKRLMNRGSVESWLQYEADYDAKRNRREIPLKINRSEIRPDKKETTRSLIFGPGQETRSNGEISMVKIKNEPIYVGKADIERMNIALIAHDYMKQEMIEFAFDYEWELGKFYRILATGTTGSEVKNATQLGDKVCLYHSGPKGGDIEIATEILCGCCDVVIFFIDPLHPHPHLDDIRVVMGACMLRPNVLMITNEMHAREWMAQVGRRLRDST